MEIDLFSVTRYCQVYHLLQLSAVPWLVALGQVPWWRQDLRFVHLSRLLYNKVHPADASPHCFVCDVLSN